MGKRGKVVGFKEYDLKDEAAMLVDFYERILPSKTFAILLPEV